MGFYWEIEGASGAVTEKSSRKAMNQKRKVERKLRIKSCSDGN